MDGTSDMITHLQTRKSDVETKIAKIVLELAVPGVNSNYAATLSAHKVNLESQLSFLNQRLDRLTLRLQEEVVLCDNEAVAFSTEQAAVVASIEATFPNVYTSFIAALRRKCVDERAAFFALYAHASDDVARSIILDAQN